MLSEVTKAGQLQIFLDEVNCLDHFQSRFRPGYETESALVTLVDDMHQEVNSATLFILLNFSAAVNTIANGILLDHLSRLELEGTIL